MVFPNENYSARLRPILALAGMYDEADLVADREIFKAVLGHGVAVKIDLLKSALRMTPQFCSGSMRAIRP